MKEQQVVAILAFMGAITTLGFAIYNLHQQFVVQPAGVKI